ncbi:transposase zinc-binding domain-containing protein [[Clostridium] scindens]|nr:transposase zinc-binding domain-containing protein [[Clostridium] scindens]
MWRIKFVPFRCKSRFCPTCGNTYNQLRSFHMYSKLAAFVHCHCVFMILRELRVYSNLLFVSKTLHVEDLSSCSIICIFFLISCCDKTFVVESFLQ